MNDGEQKLWDRKCSILLLAETPAQKGNNPSAFTPSQLKDDAWDISDMHCTFEIHAEDQGVPENCRIRVENLKEDTVSKIQKEFQRVVIQAGYWNAPYGVIFTGNIMQFRKGRRDAKTTYLEILAADNDLAYNFTFMSQPLVGGSTPQQRMAAVATEFKKKGLDTGFMQLPTAGGVLPRGKVFYGLARVYARRIADDRGASWNILKGKMNVIPLDGYLPGEAVELTAKTGLIGRAEQTEQGVFVRCLINPEIRVGGLIKLNNTSVNVTQQAPKFALFPGQLPYDRYVGNQLFADVTADGLYRVVVCECRGDTRGTDWYMDLMTLALDPVTQKVKQ